LSARNLRLGRPVALDEAESLAPFPLLRSTIDAYREPDAAFVGEPDGNQVTFVYVADADPRPILDAEVSLLIAQFAGQTMQDGGAVFGKGIPPNVQVEPVMVNGGRGFWISGQPHAYFYRDEQGRMVEDSLRLAGNTLLWEQGEVTLRLEGAPTKADALEIANSMR
jgi:hypothetical protein